MGNTTRFTYNEMNLLESRRDALEAEKFFTYDVEGRVRRHLDRNGRMPRLITPSGNEIRCTYDRAGRQILTERRQQKVNGSLLRD